jgi:hypothetical protein
LHFFGGNGGLPVLQVASPSSGNIYRFPKALPRPTTLSRRPRTNEAQIKVIDLAAKKITPVITSGLNTYGTYGSWENDGGSHFNI